MQSRSVLNAPLHCGNVFKLCNNSQNVLPSHPCTRVCQREPFGFVKNWMKYWMKKAVGWRIPVKVMSQATANQTDLMKPCYDQALYHKQEGWGDKNALLIAGNQNLSPESIKPHISPARVLLGWGIKSLTEQGFETVCMTWWLHVLLRLCQGRKVWRQYTPGWLCI